MVKRDARAWRLFFLLLCLMFTVILGDIASESLFLSHYSLKQLPLMFIANSFGLFLISLLIMGSIDKVTRFRLFFYLALGLGIGLLIFRTSAAVGISQAYLVLFPFAYVGKILLFLVFWTSANDLCDSREAKTIFPFVASGGVLGGIGGNFFTGFVSRFIAPENMLVLWMFLLGLCVFQMRKLAMAFPKQLNSINRELQKKKSLPLLELRDNIRAVSSEPLLKTMALLYFGLFFLLISLDYHFFSTLKAGMSAKLHLLQPELAQGSKLSNELLGKQLSSFLGYFRGVASIITFALQWFASSYLLQRLGTARTMYLLPIIFTVAFGAAWLQSTGLIFPDTLTNMSMPFAHSLFLVLLCGMAMRIALFDSVFSPNFQIFFSSLPQAIRGRGKMFLEGLLKPLAISLAGLSTFSLETWLILRNPNWISYHFLFLFVVSATLVLVVGLSLRKAYTASISATLGQGRQEKIQGTLSQLKDLSSNELKSLIKKHMDENDAALREFAIEILEKIPKDEAKEILVEYLEKPDYPEQARLISIIVRSHPTFFSSPELGEKQLLEWLKDKDSAIVISAIDGIPHLWKLAPEKLLNPLMMHPDPAVGGKALTLLSRLGIAGSDKKAGALVQFLLGRGRLESARAALQICGQVKDWQLYPQMKRAWKQVQDFHLKKQEDLGTALDMMADKQLYLLQLVDMNTSETWLEIFTQLHGSNEALREAVFQKATPYAETLGLDLAERVEQWPTSSRYQLYHFFVRIRYKVPEVSRQFCHLELLSEISRVYRLCSQLHHLGRQGSEAAMLLYYSAFEGPLHACKLAICNLVALSDQKARLFYAAPQLMAAGRFERAAAQEGIETYLPRALSSQIIPLFISEEEPRWAKIGKEVFGFDTISWEASLAVWENQDFSAWTAACAHYCRLKLGLAEDEKETKQKLTELMNANT